VHGAIGGAGRLNFSVIGGAVNVAARVEAQTRETDDNILITTETWKRLSHAFEADSRGKAELKGVAEPVALYAPKLAGEPEPAAVSDGGERDTDADIPLSAFARRLRRVARR
jgi:adenylate cyclase